MREVFDLMFLHGETQRDSMTPATHEPDRGWMVEQVKESMRHNKTYLLI